MTPYDKTVLFTAPEGRFYQQHGYVYVAVDGRSRSRGKSQCESCAFVNLFARSLNRIEPLKN